MLKQANSILGGGFKYLLFSPQPGEMIHFDFDYFSKGSKPPPSTSKTFQGLQFSRTNCALFELVVCVSLTRFPGMLEVQPVSPCFYRSFIRFFLKYLDFFEVILYGFYHGKSPFFTITRGRSGSFFPSINQEHLRVRRKPSSSKRIIFRLIFCNKNQEA